ncbi:MAG: hypothetical protein IJF71_04300 [Clostridia bacterium]|nr:hypothetical protein [Clostridia bacterium]
MRKLLLMLALCAVMCCAVVPAFALSEGDAALVAGGKSILLAHESTGVFEYDAANDAYVMSAKSGSRLPVPTGLVGAAKWMDTAGNSRMLNELQLYYKLDIAECYGVKDHTVPSVLIAKTATTETYLQNRTNGEIFMLEDVVVGQYNQIVRRAFGQQMTANEAYTMEIVYDKGKVTVYTNGNMCFNQEEVAGDPVFILTAFGGKGVFSNIEAKVLNSDFDCFVAKYPTPDAENVNLLSLADYENYTVSRAKSGLNLSGNTMTVPEPGITSDWILSNDYIEGSNYYRPDLDEYSDGSDIDWMISAEVTIDTYGPNSQPWYGMGAIIAETDNGYLSTRIMKTGTVLVDEFHKSNGQNLYTINMQFSAETSVGAKNTITAYKVGGAFYLLLNGDLLYEWNNLEVTPKMGTHVCQAAGTVEASFYFIQKVAVTENEPLSEETAQFVFSRGKGTDKITADSVMTGDISAFTVDGMGKDTYFIMESIGYKSENLYLMLGLESYREVKQSSFHTLMQAKIKVEDIGADGSFGLVFRHNVSGTSRNSLMIYADGRVTVGNARDVFATANIGAVSAESELDLRVISYVNRVFVTINGKRIFDAVETEEYNNQAGIVIDDARIEVKDFSYRYYNDVCFTEPVKETFPLKPDVPPANTEYIEPVLPKPMEGGSANAGGCSSTVTVVLIVAALVVCAAAVSAVLLIKKKKAK